MPLKTKLSRLFAKSIRKKWTSEQVNQYIGHYQQCYFTYAADENLRQTAASGGSVTALLSYLLQNGKIDGALVCRSVINAEGKLRPEFFIARSLEDLKSAQGSKYIAVRFASQAFPLIRAFDGRLAVVALPCDISILQRARLTDAEIGRKVILTIGLFCGHNSEPILTDSIVEKLRPQQQPLSRYYYRLGHWRGHLQAEFGSDHVVTRPFAYFSDYQNLYFFCQRKCHHCFDHTSYEADLSAGDIWSLRMKEEPIKHTALITRSDYATQVVQEALHHNYLVGRAEPIDEVCEGQARTLPFHYNISARAKAGRLLGEKVNDKLQTKVYWWEYLTALLIMFNEKVSRTNRGRKMILALPRPLMKLYLYFIKLLESIPTPQPELPETQPVIGVIGGTIWGNRGAESMLVTTIGKMREKYPNAQFRVFSYSPKKDRLLVNQPDVTILSCKPASLVTRFFPFSILCWLFRKVGVRLSDRFVPRVVRELRKCCILLDVSGISFVDGRELFLPFNILVNFPAMLLGVPVVKMAQALGPFRNPFNRMASRLFLPRCEQIFARGDTTLKHLLDLGLLNVTRAADIAFLYQPEYSLSAENESLVSELEARLAAVKAENQRIVAIAPSSLVYEKSGQVYIQQLIELVQKLVEDDIHFLFFANSTREGSDTPRNNDIYVLNILKQQAETSLPPQVFARMNWVMWDVNTRSLRRLIGLADLLVTSRFHAMVSGLALKIPTLVIGWSHKYVETLADFGMQSCAADFEDKDKNLFQLAQDLLRNASEVRAQLADALPHVQALSAAQFDYVERILK